MPTGGSGAESADYRADRGEADSELDQPGCQAPVDKAPIKTRQLREGSTAPRKQAGLPAILPGRSGV